MNTLILNRSLLNIQKAAVSMRGTGTSSTGGTSMGHSKNASSAASLSYTLSGASSRSGGSGLGGLKCGEHEDEDAESTVRLAIVNRNTPTPNSNSNSPSSTRKLKKKKSSRSRKGTDNDDGGAAGSPYQLSELGAGDSFLWVGEEGDQQGQEGGLVSVARLRSALPVLLRGGSGHVPTIGSKNAGSKVEVVEIEMEETAPLPSNSRTQVVPMKSEGD